MLSHHLEISMSGYCHSQEGVRKRGSAACQFWWEQPLDIEAAGLAAMAADEEGVSDDSD